jgi:ribosomal protein S6--L-glutamate ligase
MVASFHPLISAPESRLLVSQRPLDSGDVRAVARSRAVVLPQLCRRDLYCLAVGLGKPVFPRQAARLALDGKVGSLRLFAGLGLPQPRGREFSGLAAAARAWRAGELAGLGAPLVVKGAGGGMGDNVFLAGSPEELSALAGRLDTGCAHGPAGLVVQELVEAGGRDCRVVLWGRRSEAFWRVGAPGEFRANLSQGGRVDRGSDPAGLARAEELARRLAGLAGLDVAAVDLLLPPGGEPLLLEINHYFGREALGGGRAFFERYLRAVREWLAGLGLDPGLVAEAAE